MDYYYYYYHSSSSSSSSSSYYYYYYYYCQCNNTPFLSLTTTTLITPVPLQGTVRAACLVTSFIIHPLDKDGSRCDVTYVDISDPSGDAPKVLAHSYYSETRPLALIRLRELLDNHKATRGFTNPHDVDHRKMR